jgi:hypothetical protein
MEDTNQNIITNAQPSILDIKPVENLEKVVKVEQPKEEPIEIEDLKDDDIFVKPQVKLVKKKREISARQKAHMKKMNEIRKQKAEQRKAEKAKNTKPKSKPKLPPKTEVRPERKEEPMQQNFTGHKGNMSNQEYMQQFFSNMNLFMDSYNKLNGLKKPQSTPQQIPKKDHFQDMKPQKKVQQKSKPKPKTKQEGSYYIDFLKPNVDYNNYKNPFGF